MTEQTAESAEARVPDEGEKQACLNIDAEGKRIKLTFPMTTTTYIEPTVARRLAAHLIHLSYRVEGRPAPDQVPIHFSGEGEQS